MKQVQSISMKEVLKWVAVIVLAFLVGMGILKGIKGKKVATEEDIKKEEVFVKQVETIAFGAWQPGVKREVLGTIESIGDIDLTAELSGTIENVFVEIGDTVSRGQVLARYKRGDDQTFVNYQNAVASLEQAKLSAQNSVKQAEIALQTAKQEQLEQQGLQGQTKSQQFENLKITTLNTNTVINNGLDYLDRVTRASNKFRTDTVVGLNQVGQNNSILRQNLKNRVLAYRGEQQQFSNTFFSDSDIQQEAEKREKMLRNLQIAMADMETLIRQTPVTSNFSETTRSTFEQEVEGQKNAINNSLSGLTSQSEVVKSQSNQSGLGIIQAENRVKTAEANLELAKANAAGSVQASENSVASSATTLSDLDIRAPFNGVITEKTINSFQQVVPGTLLFSIENRSVAPKIVAFVTRDELDQLLGAEEVLVRINEQSITVSNAAVSTKVDIATQKIKIEYDLPQGENDVYIGSLARLVLPSASAEGSSLLPLSAIGFEPDGPEVLIVRNKEAVRQKIEIGDVRSDGAEIILGVKAGDEIIRYRSRVYAGEKVTSENEEVITN